MKQKKNTTIMYAGCAINRDMYYMTCRFSENSLDEPYSRLYFYQHLNPNKWFYHDRPDWHVVSTCFQAESPAAPRTVYALSEEGEIESLNREGTTTEKIRDAGLLPGSKQYGYVSKIKSIDGVLYVCGYQCQVYKRSLGAWEHIDQGIIQNLTAPEDTNLSFADAIASLINDTIDLLDIAGSNEKNIYTVGSNGFIAHYNGITWTTMKKATAADLHGLHIDEYGNAWAVGARGTVLYGNSITGFTVISRKTLEADFNAITEFEGTPYIAASDGIYSIIENKAHKLKITAHDVSSIESIDGVLWALSALKLIRFDGKTWTEFENIDNQNRAQ